MAEGEPGRAPATVGQLEAAVDVVGEGRRDRAQDEGHREEADDIGEPRQAEDEEAQVRVELRVGHAEGLLVAPQQVDLPLL